MKEIKELIADIVEGTDIVIEDIKMSETGGTIKVICDTETGIDSSRLVDISRKILNDPDYDASYAENYRLEVSSPGLDMPLTKVRHFIKNKGREIELTHKSEEYKSPIKGTIEDANDEYLVLALKIKKEETNIRIAMNDVESAKLRLKW